MPVFKIKHTKDYTVMSNRHLTDMNLSLKARGLLSMMLSCPEDWDFSSRWLISCCKEGRDSVNGAISELENRGYIVREQTRESGKFGDIVFNVYELPHTDFPYTEKPFTDKPYTEKPQQLNTNNTKYSNIQSINNTKYTTLTPQGETSESFDWFWSLYPKKVGKKEAIKAFKKVKVDTSVLIDALERQKSSDQWKRDKGKYIPNPATWLNGERWNDEVKSPDDDFKESLRNFVNGY